MKYLKNFTNFYHEQDTFVFWPITASLLLILAIISCWGLFYLNLPKELPIFYSLSWGDSQFGHINQFLLFPSLMSLTIFVNLILSWHLHYSQVLIKRILAIATFIICLLFATAALKIIFTFV
ncbi:hypothetical protein HYW44_02095 [Candidatus Daviesbacteria bacterium]|nr:hypothetical protein [Candidatus Daviesbacteria bacterium]